MWARAATILLLAAASFCATAEEPPRPAEPSAAAESPASARPPAPAEPPAAALDAPRVGPERLVAGLPHTPPPPRPPSLAPRPPKSFVVPAAEAALVQGIAMAWNVWPGKEAWSNVSLESIERNATSGWWIDADGFFTNQLGHPYQGALPFSAARSAGLGFWESLPYAFVASLAWEVAGETEPPSINDQITTSIGGVVAGELLHRLAESLRGPVGGGWREVAAFAASPFSTVNRSLLGRPLPPAREPVRWELTAGAEASRGPGPELGAAPGWSGRGKFGLSLVHGLPWHPDLVLDRPFDHFALEFGWSGGEDRRVTFLVRALVAGAAHGSADGWRGASGLFALLDLDTPGDFRVGTIGLGPGTTGGVALGRGLALEATAVVAAIPMGAAGTRPAVVPEGRDYRLGPGAQALAELALTVRERASLRIGARGYAIAGADGGGGHELVASLRAQTLVRVAGHHGLGVEAELGARRAAEDGFPDREQLGRRVSLVYVLSGMNAPRPARGAGELALR